MQSRPVIIDAIRTPGGKRNGQLSGWHPVDLAAQVLNGALARSGVSSSVVDDVIMGCVSQIGAQGMNVGRNALLAAGWPETIPATTIDRQCGSSQQAIHFAAQSIMAGVNDVVVAAGIECMSWVPMFSNIFNDPKATFGPLLNARYEDQVNYGEHGLVNQGLSAELIADKWNFSREEIDGFAFESQERAARAQAEGRFDEELLALDAKRRNPEDLTQIETIGTATRDEGIRSTTPEKLAQLKPAFLETGKITAGNSSQITDGASAALIMSEEKAKELGLRPRAYISGFSVVGVDPITMLTGPIPATQKLLERANLSVEDIDLFEVNEAFAPVVLAWAEELKADLSKVNVNGGGIALGHPLGASGTKLLATLLHELERRNGRYGVITMCEGGGMANATLIERIAS